MESYLRKLEIVLQEDMLVDVWYFSVFTKLKKTPVLHHFRNFWDITQTAGRSVEENTIITGGVNEWQILAVIQTTLFYSATKLTCPLRQLNVKPTKNHRKTQILLKSEWSESTLNFPWQAIPWYYWVSISKRLLSRKREIILPQYITLVRSLPEYWLCEALRAKMTDWNSFRKEIWKYSRLDSVP